MLRKDKDGFGQPGPMQDRAPGVDRHVRKPPPAWKRLARAGDADSWIDGLNRLDDRAALAGFIVERRACRP